MDPGTPPEIQGGLLLDQCLPPHTQCQFILRPSGVAQGQDALTGNPPSLPLHTIQQTSPLPSKLKGGIDIQTE